MDGDTEYDGDFFDYAPHDHAVFFYAHGTGVRNCGWRSIPG